MPTDSPPLRITLLGTGTSTGIPVIGCTCHVCRSSDPRDTRSRCACLVETDDLTILIDTGPDFRQQALREDIDRVDAVLYTHHHFDHVAGLDDLRPFFFGNKAPIPCFARANVAAVLRERFDYIFKDGTYPGLPELHLHEVNAPFVIDSRYGLEASLAVTPVEVFHGTLPMYGYRIGHFAYLTDTNRLPEASFDLLNDLEVLILDALRTAPHPTHFSFDDAVAVARRIGAQQTYFIHMTHSVLHAEIDATLPDGIALGYDGLSLEIS